MISNRMLQICGASIYTQLEIVCKTRLKTGCSLSEWKKANVVPVDKKGDKQLKFFPNIALIDFWKITRRINIWFNVQVFHGK